MKNTKKQDIFIDKKGRKIPFCSWIPSKSLCQVVVVHGFSEHMVCYQAVADELSKKGIAVHMMDLPGHGMAEGTRGHIDGFADYLDNLDQLIHENPYYLKSKSTFLIGHSLGGLIAIHYCLERNHRLSGVILSAPLTGFPLLDRIKVLPLAKLLAKKHRNIPFPKPVGVKSLSRDPEMWEVYYSDPCRGRLISPNLYLEMSKMVHKVQSEAHAFDLPLLMFLSSKDTVVCPEAAQRFFSKTGSTDKSMVVFAEAMHELFQERENEQILITVDSWIRKRVK